MISQTPKSRLRVLEWMNFMLMESHSPQRQAKIG